MVATYRVLPCRVRDKLIPAGCTTALWGRGVPSQGVASSGPDRPRWGWLGRAEPQLNRTLPSPAPPTRPAHGNWHRGPRSPTQGALAAWATSGHLRPQQRKQGSQVRRPETERASQEETHECSQGCVGGCGARVPVRPPGTAPGQEGDRTDRTWGGAAADRTPGPTGHAAASVGHRPGRRPEVSFPVGDPPPPATRAGDTLRIHDWFLQPRSNRSLRN